MFGAFADWNESFELTFNFQALSMWNVHIVWISLINWRTLARLIVEAGVAGAPTRTQDPKLKHFIFSSALLFQLFCLRLRRTTLFFHWKSTQKFNFSSPFPKSWELSGCSEFSNHTNNKSPKFTWICQDLWVIFYYYYTINFDRGKSNTKFWIYK